MRIGIDLDGVLFPFTELLNRYIERRMGLDEGTLPRWKHWHSHEKHLGLSHTQFLELYRDAVLHEELFLQASPTDESRQTLFGLMDAGHKIVIVTDRSVPGAERESRAQTFAWLKEWHVPHDEVFILKNKLDATCDLYLDDRPQAIPTFLLAGRQAVYWDRPWNAWFPYPRVSSWNEFVEYLEDHNV